MEADSCFAIMPKSPTTSPHVMFAGLEAGVAAAVKLWLTRSEGISVDVIDLVPERRSQLPKSLGNVTVLALPQKYWSTHTQELMNASFFPGIPVILTCDRATSGNAKAARGNKADNQTFLFELKPSNMEKLPHLLGELHQVSRRRWSNWKTSPEPRNGEAEDLTDKELQVLTCIARGYSNWAIATELQVSEKSVEAKLTSIYEKLSLQTDAKQLNLRVAAALHFYGLDTRRGG